MSATSYLKMDASSIKAKALNRRATSSSVEWTCNYCRKTFIQEKSFMQHNCKGKQRVEIVKTPIGQAAFANYSSWLKYKRHTVQNISTFMSSRYFISFIKFAEYCDRLKIDADTFIKLMVQKHADIGPTLWCSSSVYSLYLSYYDSIHDPWEQVAQTHSFLERKAEILECEISEVLNKMGFQEVLNSFRLKKISPWYLFTADHTRNFLKSLDSDDYKLFEQVIDYAAWANRFAENRHLTTEISNILNSPS